ncbi:MAG: hypothetical protein AB7O68_17365 [Pirellulales bacterium]
MPERPRHFNREEADESYPTPRRSPTGPDALIHVNLPPELVTVAAEFAMEAFLSHPYEVSTETIFHIRDDLPTELWHPDTLGLVLGDGTPRVNGLQLWRSEFGGWYCCFENVLICMEHMTPAAVDQIATRLNSTPACVIELVSALPKVAELRETCLGDDEEDDPTVDSWA